MIWFPHDTPWNRKRNSGVSSSCKSISTRCQSQTHPIRAMREAQKEDMREAQKEEMMERYVREVSCRAGRRQKILLMLLLKSIANINSILGRATPRGGNPRRPR
jgi:hypothetical protein